MNCVVDSIHGVMNCRKGISIPTFEMRRMKCQWPELISLSERHQVSYFLATNLRCRDFVGMPPGRHSGMQARHEPILLV